MVRDKEVLLCILERIDEAQRRLLDGRPKRDEEVMREVRELPVPLLVVIVRGLHGLI